MKMELETFDVISLVLSFCTIFVHGIGLLLVFRKKSIILKHAEIFSISCSTVLLNLIMTVRLLVVCYFNDRLIDRYLYNLGNAITVPFYGNVIILTLQRFFAIRLHLMFEDSWIKLKRISAVISTWLIAFIFLATTFVWLIITGPNPVWQYVIWIQGSIGPILVNIISISVYIYIYIKYKRAKETKELFKKKKRKIFSPFIICLSFLIFGTLPHFFQHKVKKLSYSLIWFSLDGISNSIVYLILNKTLDFNCNIRKYKIFKRWNQTKTTAIKVTCNDYNKRDIATESENKIKTFEITNKQIIPRRPENPQFPCS